MKTSLIVPHLPFAEPKPAASIPRQNLLAIKAPLIFIAVIVGIAFAYFAWSVMLPFMLALIASMTLKPPVTWLRSHRFPASLAAATVLGIFIVVIGFAALWLGRPAVEWAQSAPEKIPQLKQKVVNILQPVMRISAVASSVGNLDPAPAPKNVAPPVTVKESSHMIGAMFTWTRSLLAGVTESIILTFLLLAAGDAFRKKLVHEISSKQHKKRAVEISQEVQHSISSYLFTVSLINIGFGCVAGIGFWLAGMPNAAMWGGVAALLNFLPFFGPIIGIAVVSVAGLLAFDTVGQALLPVTIYMLLHLAESYLLTPFAMGQRFSLNPVVIFVAFIFFAWLWGIFGAFLAVPLLVSFKVICERVPQLSSLSEFLSP